MRRRMIGLSSLLSAALLVSAVGCEVLRPATRSHHNDDNPATADELEPKAIDGDATKIRAFDSTGKTAGSQSFFKNSRLPGAMSAEGREIEQSLGVH